MRFFAILVYLFLLRWRSGGAKNFSSSIYNQYEEWASDQSNSVPGQTALHSPSIKNNLYITLEAGKLFVLDLTATPMSIVGEYD
jgi:hypothetical protein